MVYQPQYNYKQKKIIGYEALIRWENKNFSNIGPNVFIPNVQLLKDDFVDNVKKIVQEMDIDTKYIKFEVTESVLIESFDFIANQLSKLNQIGISIALDDFGTVYSSLTHLNKLPLDTIKIDESFIDEIINIEGEHFLIDTIFDIGKNLIIQGYYYSKPLIDEVIYEKYKNLDM